MDSSLLTNRDIVSNGVNYGQKSVKFMNVRKSASGTYVCKMHGSLPGEKVLEEKAVDVVVLGEFKSFWTKNFFGEHF